MEDDLDQKETKEFLTFDDIKELIPPNPTCVDKETQEFLYNFKKNLFIKRMEKVNQYAEELHQAWPQGRLIDCFIALELCNNDITQVLENIRSPQFTRTLISEAAQRGVPQKNAQPRSSTSLYEADFDSDSEDLSPRRKKRKKKNKRIAWESHEIDEFIFEYKKQAPILNWAVFSSQFFGKTEEQCLQLYAKLKREGKIYEGDDTVDIPIKNRKVPIIGITFVNDNRSVRVGPISTANEERISLNPIPGYIDMITQKPMDIPAISPDGYVLDYNTWLKLINESKVNPFTQNKITSKRQLTILTIDNYEEMKDKIINLESAKPPV